MCSTVSASFRHLVPAFADRAFVVNLPWDITNDELKDAFGKYVGRRSSVASLDRSDHSRGLLRFGKVIDVRIVTDKNTGRAKGYAYIQYDNAVSVVLAAALSRN